MDVSHRAHEILEKYWKENRERKNPWGLEVLDDDPVVDELRQGGYARAGKENAKKLELSAKGWDEARSCVRRHRLAERMMADVLALNDRDAHQAGCTFEHALHKRVEKNICTLLGHPAVCPHGSPIPDGGCCREDGKRLPELIKPLAACDAKAAGKVAYIRSGSGHIMDKLTAMGILPGIPIRLISRSPAYLFQVGESQFAIDKELAAHIHVRLD